MDNPADDAARRDYGGIRFQAVRRALVDSYRLAACGIASDDAGHYGLSHAVFLQADEFSNALCLENPFRLLDHLHSEVIILALQPDVLVMNSNQRDVLIPHVSDAVESAVG